MLWGAIRHAGYNVVKEKARSPASSLGSLRWPRLSGVLNTRGRILTQCPRSAQSYTQVPHYAALKLDRAAELRKDSERLRELEHAQDAQLVLLQAYSGLLAPAAGNSNDSNRGPKWKLATLPAGAVSNESCDPQLGRIFLGLDERQRPFFAVSVLHAAAERVAAQHDQAEWVELRREGGPNLAPEEAALVAYAAGLVYWARRNYFSGISGKELAPAQGGHARAAEGERPVFTRIDPAVIMAVTCGDWILLGRQSRWSQGRYSLLAGFCEIGETLEQAVARETLEEARVSIVPASVAYHSSQPWPFPQSLMIGFTAAANEAHIGRPLQGEGADIARRKGITAAELQDAHESAPLQPNPDTRELEAAFWFHRSFVASSLEGLLPLGVEFAIPGPHALASRIIADWVGSGRAAQTELERLDAAEVDVGRFKYVLLRVSDGQESRLVVRGDRDKAFHADIVGACEEQLSTAGFKVDVLGGGRIENSVDSIRVFGYSSAFGPAPHEVTASLLRRRYPMADIRVSYSGY